MCIVMLIGINNAYATILIGSLAIGRPLVFRNRVARGAYIKAGTPRLSITSNHFAITLFAPVDNLSVVNPSWENSPRNALLRLRD